MAAAETARLIASLELQDKNFTRGIKQVERGIGRVDKKLGAFSGAVNRNVGRAVDNVTARLLEVPGAVISAAVEQEAAITGIAKTVEGDISGLTEELKKLSTETGSTFTELAGIAELGGAMGVAKDDLASFTETVAILGATTNVTTEDAATALGQLQNVLGLTGDDFDNFASSLVDLGNKGASTEAQILEIAKRSGAAAKLIGVAKNETLGWASAAANLGINEELAGTALQNFFLKTQTAITGGGEDLKDLAKISGVTAKDFKKMWGKDATGALQSFLTGLGKMTKGDRIKAVQAIYGKGSGMTRLILGLADSVENNLNPALEDGTKAWDEHTAAGKEAEKRFATSEFLFKRLGNSVNLVAATIGTELLPVLNDLATEGLAFLNKPATQKGIKDLAVGIGKGVRAIAGIVTSINWGAVAGFLSTAAGFAGQLVTWFTKMPDWAQAFLIGGFAVTKLPVIGSIVSELGKGLIKGVLGMTAGVVNIKAGVVTGAGGVPIPGAKPGGILSDLKGGILDLGKAVTGLGLTAAAGLTIAAIAPIALFGLTKAIIDATGKPIPERELEGRVETAERRGVPKRNQPAKPGDVPRGGLSGDALKRFEARVNGAATALGKLETRAGGAPGAFRPGPRDPETGARPRGPETPPSQKPVVEKLTAANVALSGIKTGITTQTSAQTAELGNIKNATATLSTSITTQNTAQTVALSGIKTGLTVQQTELDNIKNASATLNTSITTQGAAQTTALGTINTSTVTGLGATKTATTTLDANEGVRAATATALQTAANVGAVVQSAAQVAAASLTTSAARQAGTVAAGASRSAGAMAAAASSSSASRIVSAIWAARPVIQPTTIIERHTVTERGGATSDSRTRGGQ